MGLAPVVRPHGAVRMASPTMGVIEDTAAECLEEGCPIDMVDDLILQLKEESKSLAGKEKRDVTALIKNLILLNAEGAAPSEIEKTIKSAMRTFSVVESYSFPGEALGYSTKPSKGNTIDTMA